MKRILYSCPYIPAEWIAAHGCTPCRVLPQGQYAPDLEGLEGVCTFARAFVSDVLRDDQGTAVIMTTLCDQMRRAFDLYTSLDPRPGFLFNVPSTWQPPQSRRLYADELKRLGRFLTRLGGTPPEAGILAQTMRTYDAQRAGRDIAPTDCQPRDKVRLALVGGPRVRTDGGLQKLLETCGACLVLDATETGLLGNRRPFDQKALHNSFDEMVDAYFDSIHHVGRRPNTGFYQCLQEALPAHRVQGIIWRRYLWCDLWHAELAHFREACALPIMDLEVSDILFRDRARVLNRMQAFVEMLK